MTKSNVRHALKKTMALAMAGWLMAQGNLALAAPAMPTSWEVSGEFDYLTPPVMAAAVGASVWRYGWRSGFTNPSTAPNMMLGPVTPSPLSHRGWQKTPGTDLPLVAQNSYMTPQTYIPYAPITIPARGMQLHPGYACETAVVRFIAPYPAQYRVSGQFYGLDNNASGTKTTNRVIASTQTFPNPPPLHLGSVNMPNAGQSSFSSKLVMLPAGGTLDFEVGCGAGGNYFFGSTGLHAVIEKTSVEYCEWNGLGNTPC